MPSKPRWSELERERHAPADAPPSAGRASGAASPRASSAAWGSWRALESAPPRARATATPDTLGTASSMGSSAGDADSEPPFLFSIDDVTLRSGVAVLEYTPPTRRLPPPVRELDRARMMGIHGSLRMGGPVRLRSRQLAGYAVCAVCLSLSAAALEAAVAWLRPRAFGLDSFREVRGLLRLKWAVAFPIGLLSDAVAPLGYRRKGFMLAGWAALALVWAVQLVAYHFRESLFASATPPPALALALAAVAMLALAAVDVPLAVRVLELAQQEELLARGAVVTTYLALSLLPQLVVRAAMLATATATATESAAAGSGAGGSSTSGASSSVAAAPGEDERLDPEVSVAVASAVLLVVALTPIPFLVTLAHEPRAASASAPARPLLALLRWRKLSKRVGDAFSRLWAAVHSKAVSDVVIVNALLFFFTAVESPGSAAAVSAWSGETVEYALARAVGLHVTMLLAVLLWRRVLSSASWVSSLLLVLLVWKISAVAWTALVALGALRQPWVPAVAALGVAPAKVALSLCGLLPTLEVVHQGGEGGVYGLVVAFQLLTQVLAGHIVSAVQRTGVLVAPERTVDDTHANRLRVVVGAAVLSAVSLLSLLAVCFLPRQKPEAQHRRVLGGYSSSRRLALALGFAALYILAAALELVDSPQSGRFE